VEEVVVLVVNATHVKRAVVMVLVRVYAADVDNVGRQSHQGYAVRVVVEW
jgi:hypothetical protein